ncbi:ISWI chromatin-remodeling complex ATPase ISW2 [Smittium culicis]|uniref:ISWI chromatin-remodeling complex ATPase ISW2 n=2 Tax=Smittium culicis TaxID=133412 RepID=A0A1R1YL19_9FUNG|nr:ISWI chromatin-remodeling complex ATPase ISW2 [Smittium culicis]
MDLQVSTNPEVPVSLKVEAKIEAPGIKKKKHARDKPDNRRARRFAYLLEQTEIFSHFLNIDDLDQDLKNEIDFHLAKMKSHKASAQASFRHRKAEKEEDAELIQSGVSSYQNPFMFLQTPPYVKGGSMREYQIRGLNWMIGLHENGLNGILADEMGLGKTLQTISFLGYLKHYCNTNGPNLIVVPKTTLHNWKTEFAKWVPTIVPLMLHGDKETRKKIIENGLYSDDLGCVITTYEMCIICKTQLSKINWKYIIIDEAHRIKNEKSSLSQIMRILKSENRLLITGTPLQNNLHELWALLNFLLPDVFDSSEDFDDYFIHKKSSQLIKDKHESNENSPKKDLNGTVQVVPNNSNSDSSFEHLNDKNVTNDTKQPNDEYITGSNDSSSEKAHITKPSGNEIENTSIVKSENLDVSPNSESKENVQDESVQQLQRVLQPFLLRRIKSEVEKSILPKKEVNVYVGLTQMQKIWYKRILEKDLDAVNGIVGKKEGKMRLLNIVMQLRKCCNHPYLFNGAEPGPPYTTDEHIVTNSGKMVVLDKLLLQKKQAGSRVLIFSQMSRLLDILEDYCMMRGFEYCRIDGQTSHEERVEYIDAYNKPNSSKFIFLLTTRAGGLGINLTTADTVVIYDSDWNPQADLQAQDRAHRIGQTKQVHIYRFVTENAVEEKVLEKAMQKLRLDQLVIQKANQANANSNLVSQNELLKMVQFGALDIVTDDSSSAGRVNGSGSKGDDKAESSGGQIDLDSLLLKSAKKTAEIRSKYSSMGLGELVNFEGENVSYKEQYMEGEGNSSGMNTSGLNSGATTPGNGTGKGSSSDMRKLPGLGLVNANMLFIQPAKRERKANYSVDEYYRELMRNGGVGMNSGGRGNHQSSENKTPKLPKQPAVNDFNFYPQELVDILKKERDYYSQLLGLDDKDDETEDSGDDYLGEDEEEEEGSSSESNNGDGEGHKSKKVKLDESETKAVKSKQAKSASKEKLEFTEEDVAKKNLLIEKCITANDMSTGEYGFPDMNKRDYNYLLRLFEKYGSSDMDIIARNFEGKDEVSMRVYVEHFMRHYKSKLEDPARVDAAIAKGEAKRKQTASNKALLDQFYSQVVRMAKEPADTFNYEGYLLLMETNFYNNPSNGVSCNQFRLNYQLHKSNRFHFSETEDMFLLFCMHQLDLEMEDLFIEIKNMIKDSELFRFNFYIKTRTINEIQRRCHNLLTLLGKQFNL